VKTDIHVVESQYAAVNPTNDTKRVFLIRIIILTDYLTLPNLVKLRIDGVLYHFTYLIRE